MMIYQTMKGEKWEDFHRLHAGSKPEKFGVSTVDSNSSMFHRLLAICDGPSSSSCSPKANNNKQNRASLFRKVGKKGNIKIGQVGRPCRP